MPNYFKDNTDLVFQFEHLNIKEIVAMAEDDFQECKSFDYAPCNYEDALANYRQVLEIVGDIAANRIEPTASDVDEEGALFNDGTVTYAKGIQDALEELTKAELMGFSLPRQYGGLNFPITIYTMAIEVVSKADASLMNLFGLQDIADTINKFGSEEQKSEFLPGFSKGEYTGAMVLTEPDAGSDLQAVKMEAYQDKKGQWYLKGVKRFITNGNGDVHLVLARSEPGTKDGRGLSLYVCYNDDTVTVRRIESKLGIHGSPTCELQYNDTPAQLIGKRRMGLIRYGIDLLNGARLAVSAQALGIAQAAYEAALEYAKARVQFGKPIYDIPVVTNMLIDMRVMLESNRSLLYAAAQWVDLRNKLNEKIERLKAAKQSYEEENIRMKEATRVAALLTPITKYVLTESANKITYDSLQIHGGAGYMKDFSVERLARDARITNIYEGTSQMQIVAAAGGVINDLLRDFFKKYEKKEYTGHLVRLAEHLREIRKIYVASLAYVMDRNDKDFQDVAAKELVDLYSYLYIGYLLLDEAEADGRKKFIANRYIVSALARAHQNAEAIKNEQFSDLLHADEILS